MELKRAGLKHYIVFFLFSFFLGRGGGEGSILSVFPSGLNNKIIHTLANNLKRVNRLTVKNQSIIESHQLASVLTSEDIGTGTHLHSNCHDPVGAEETHMQGHTTQEGSDCQQVWLGKYRSCCQTHTGEEGTCLSA